MCLWYRLSVHCLFSFQKKKTWILKSIIKKIYSYLETFPFHRQANLQSEFSAEVFFIFDFCSFYSLKSAWFGVVFKCVIMKEAVAVFLMVTEWAGNPDPAAVPTGPQADLQHLVQGTHQCSWLLPPSLPVDKPPPAVGTVPALQGTNVLLLLGDRTGQTTEFKRTRESHWPAGCPFSSTHLPPCLAKAAVMEATGKRMFGSDCSLDCSVSFCSLSQSYCLPFIYSVHKHLLSLCYMPGNLLSAKTIDLNISFFVLDKVIV